MSVVILIVGLVATAVGFFAIGFGIAPSALNFGNTLISAGSISAATGLLLISISAVLRQLRKIHLALQGRAPSHAAETVEPLAPPVARMTPAVVPSPMPTRPAPRPDSDAPPLPEMFSTGLPQAAEPPPRMPEPPVRMPEPPPRMPEPPPRMPDPPPRVIEPRFPVTAASEPAPSPAPAPGPLDWLRSKSKPVAPATPQTPMRPIAPEPMPSRPVAMEPSAEEVFDEAPLSPRPLQRVSITPPPSEPAEPKAWTPPGRHEGPPELPPQAEPPMARPAPPPEPPKPKDGFDLVWPDRAPTTAPASEAAKREPALDMPLPPVPARPRESKPADRKPPGPARMTAERGPAILKSGVIDGMPYTLYADGSIEAELPQGTVKFASVDALRTHLEKQG
ncbi:hypothetical protein [Rhodoplanes sp. Z2-YC6860]|uniref:hypothetical protein n=1 Tax=Rhodoplanes sp. Z2-YC6860 TaxID=674703 RepID=UPI00078E315A|nr:hypothetical protein [Rhodoplanes sp. Z2-YC6860]AMN41347.1 hypothetical protein RHPLAN_29100 [Rhodoplanes sp. Z2-YC6860]